MYLLKAFAIAWGWKFWLAPISMAVVSYLCGCFNGAVVVSEYILKDDVRTHGSGNAGLTNFLRVFGARLAALVLLADVLKMVAAVLISVAIMDHFAGGDPLMQVFARYWGGFFCLLGHMFPCAFRFEGGKGILSGGVLAIMLDWRIALAVWGVFLVLAVLTKYVSLGSVCAGAVFPFATWFVYREPFLLGMAALSAGLVLWQHRGNISRLLHGNESKFSLPQKSNGMKSRG